MNVPDPGYASWMLAILPQMEQHSLYNALNTGHPGWSSANETVVRSAVEAYICPNDLWSHERYHSFAAAGDVEMAFSSYVGNLGSNFIVDYLDWGSGIEPDGVLYRQSSVRTADIVDGTSHTLLVGERVHADPLLRPVWGFGYTGKVVGDTSVGIVQGTDSKVHWGYSSFHPAGSVFALADGSVRLMSRETGAEFLSFLATRAGQETSPDQSF